MRTPVPYRLALILAARVAFCAVPVDADIRITRTPDGLTIRYRSADNVYVEGLRGGRWVARQWMFAGAKSTGSGDLPAFEMAVRTTPSRGHHPLELSRWSVMRAEETAASQDTGSRHAVVELSSRETSLNVKVHTILDGTPVMKRWLEITNRSPAPIALAAVFPWSGRLWSSASNVSVGYATRSECCWEGWFGWKRLTPGVNLIRQEHGLAYDHPYFVLHSDSTNDFFFGQLEWPVNRLIEFDLDDGVNFRFGPTAANALRVIAAGESVSTPAVHLSHTHGSFDEAVQAMHDHVRRSVLPVTEPGKSYRVECLMPEDQPTTVYRGKEHNEANLRKFLDVAGQLGIELFILDGPTWAANNGAWRQPQPEQFPGGLGPLIKHAHSRQLLFGLYSEPEGGRNGYTSANGGLTIGPWQKAKIVQQHPEWFEGRRYVLNLAKRGAAEYLEEQIAGMIRHYGLDLYRHDFNTPMQGEGSVTVRDGFVESDYWRHYEALNRTFDHIRTKFPNVILQQASAGGTRLDLGTVARFTENYTSDRVSMPYVYRMLSGISVYLPPESLVTPIGMAPPGERPDLDTMLRSIYGLANTPMVFNSLLPRDTEQLQDTLREKFLHYTALYRTVMRPMLATVKVYHHAPVNASGGVESGPWFAMEFASADRRKGWATIIRLTENPDLSYMLKLRGIDPSRSYKITMDSSGATQTVPGRVLAEEGLTIHPGASTSSELLLYEVT